MAEQPTCELKLLVNSRLAAAIIGRGGHAVRRIKTESGVRHIHLSDNTPGGVDRAVTVTGPMEALHSAYVLIAEILRQEVGLPEGATETVRVLLPDAASLVGETAIGQLRKASGGAHIEVRPSPLGGKEKVITCTGSAEQAMHVALNVAEAVAERHHARHRDFLSQWGFETCYNDHFETPMQAYADILPLLRSVALQSWRRQQQRKRKRAQEVGVAEGIVAQLTLYDPYYCQGSMRAGLVDLGLTAERCINENRDFYRCSTLPASKSNTPRARPVRTAPAASSSNAAHCVVASDAGTHSAGCACT